MKLVFWIVVVLALMFGLRLLNAAKAKRRGNASGRGPATPPPAETMVRCARCGVYLPQKDAVPGAAGPTCGDPACAKPR
jgi:uncharacterized protein